MLRVFEAFSGYGSQSLALKKYGVDFESVGTSEIDESAIIAAAAIHCDMDIAMIYPPIDKILERFISRNISFNFKTGVNPWVKILEKGRYSERLVIRIQQLFKACILTKNFGDISRINPEQIPDFDFGSYSFPCQDISMAGKQRGLEEGSGSRSSLLWEFQKIIIAKRPKYLMMENVKNLVGKKHKPDFDRWLKVLEGLGYQNHWKVINAKYCGVPQNRERVFCVSILGGGDFSFYDDFDSGIRLKDVLEDDVDDKYYLSDAMTKTVLKTGTKNFYYPPEIDCDIAKPLTASMAKMHRACQDNYISEKFEKTGERTLLKINGEDVKIVEACAIRGRNPKDTKSRESGLPTKQMLEVKKESHISNCLTTVQKDSLVLESNKLNMIGMLDIKGNESIKRVYDPKGISPALTTMQGGNRQPKVVEKPNCRIRKLTPRECFRLMGVSDSDIDKIQAAGISNTQQYKMAGNSIVVDCMKFLKELIN